MEQETNFLHQYLGKKRSAKSESSIWEAWRNTIQEIDDILENTGIKVSQCRLRALPAHSEIEKFIERHETTIVLEINRDGQLYGTLRKEIPIDLVPKLRSVAYSDGMPPRAQIYADMILETLKEGQQ